MDGRHQLIKRLRARTACQHKASKTKRVVKRLWIARALKAMREKEIVRPVTEKILDAPQIGVSRPCPQNVGVDEKNTRYTAAHPLKKLKCFKRGAITGYENTIKRPGYRKTHIASIEKTRKLPNRPAQITKVVVREGLSNSQSPIARLDRFYCYFDAEFFE